MPITSRRFGTIAPSARHRWCGRGRLVQAGFMRRGARRQVVVRCFALRYLRAGRRGSRRTGPAGLTGRTCGARGSECPRHAARPQTPRTVVALRRRMMAAGLPPPGSPRHARGRCEARPHLVLTWACLFTTRSGTADGRRVSRIGIAPVGPIVRSRLDNQLVRPVTLFVVTPSLWGHPQRLKLARPHEPEIDV